MTREDDIAALERSGAVSSADPGRVRSGGSPGCGRFTGRPTRRHHAPGDRPGWDVSCGVQTGRFMECLPIRGLASSDQAGLLAQSDPAPQL
jgi:hypothetical protein